MSSQYPEEEQDRNQKHNLENTLRKLPLEESQKSEFVPGGFKKEK